MPIMAPLCQSRAVAGGKPRLFIPALRTALGHSDSRNDIMAPTYTYKPLLQRARKFFFLLQSHSASTVLAETLNLWNLRSTRYEWLASFNANAKSCSCEALLAGTQLSIIVFAGTLTPVFLLLFGVSALSASGLLTASSSVFVNPVIWVLSLAHVYCLSVLIECVY